MAQSDPEMRAAQTAMARGDFVTAERLASEALAGRPSDAELLHLQGCARLRQGKLRAAQSSLALAAALMPSDPAINYNFGNACGAVGDFRSAARAMLAATVAVDIASDAWFKIGTALGHCQLWQPAAAAMLLAARRDGNHADAMMGLAACALQLIRAGEHPRARRRATVATGKLSFIVCSITPAKVDRLRTRLQYLLREGDWELIAITDARSLCEGYNRGIAASNGDLLVLCHDDILLLANDFESRLRGYLAEFELIGVAGGTRIDGPSWTMSGPPHIHCWIAHLDEQKNPVVLLLGTLGPVVGNARVLDGVFLAGGRGVFERIGFDSETFDGFHLYDIDFSYRAALAGVKMAVCLDLGILHESDGHYDDVWRSYAARFMQKFAHSVHLLPAQLNLGRARLDEPGQLVPLQDWLASWTTNDDALLEDKVRTAVRQL